jgi:dihydropteroate synthase
MGVVNVTPDSFSDGGRFFDPEAAVEHGLALLAEGADIVDVGGESTRPGAKPVEQHEELRRVLPVVQELSRHGRVSIDTMKAAVAEAAIEAGATLVNDVSASLWHVAAAAGPSVGFVAMHMQGEPQTMQRAPQYDDVVREVREFLVARASAALEAGVEDVWIDPGIGFGKTFDHNLSLLKHLRALVDTGFPVVIATSRKKFLQLVTGVDSASDVGEASLATAVVAMRAGARMIRAHDVLPTVQAATLVGAAA